MSKKADAAPWPVLVKFPTWLVRELDAEAQRLGTTRVSVVINELVRVFEKRKAK